MKANKAIIFILILLFITQPVLKIMAAVDPKKLTPMKMEAWCISNEGSGQGMDILINRNGEMLIIQTIDELEVGDRWNFTYTPALKLVFWNVGEAGGEDYGIAELYRADIADHNGYIVEEDKSFGGTGTKDVPSNTPVVIPPKLMYTFSFSGGADGVFTLDGEVVMSMMENGARININNWNIPLVFGNQKYNVRSWNLGFFAEEPIKPVCSVSALSGQIEWSPTGERNTWKLLQFGEKLPENAHVKTQEDSFVILTFPDLSQYHMKEDSHIVLTTDPNTKRSKLSIAAGRVWVNIKEMLETGSMEVEMQQAVCGIKGTTFVCEEIDGISTLKVIEGTVEFTSKITSEAVMVEGGQLVLADAGGLSEITTFDADAEKLEWAAQTAEVAGSTEPLVTPEPDSDTGINLYIMIIAAALVIVVIIAITIVVAKNRKKNRNRPAPVYAAVQPPPQQTYTSYCAQCGNLINHNSSFCTKCGNRIK